MNAEQGATSSIVNENTCHSATVTFCELNSGKETEPYIVSPAKIAEENSPSNEHEMKYAVSISQMYVAIYVQYSSIYYIINFTNIHSVVHAH